MVDVDMGSTQSAQEPPDPAMFAPGQGGGYAPHPLFPLDDERLEHRDIQYVTFRRRRADGKIENCPEDIPASEIQSWADVVGHWGGGDYKAIGENKHHRIVASYPQQSGDWMLFGEESRPLSLRESTRARYNSPMVAPAPAAAPPPQSSA